MPILWQPVYTEFLQIKLIFDKIYKCLNKSTPPTVTTQIKHFKVLCEQHERIRRLLATNFHKFNADQQRISKDIFFRTKLKLNKLLSRYNLKVTCPDSFETPLNINIEDFFTERLAESKIEEADFEVFSISDFFDSVNKTEVPERPNIMATTVADFLSGAAKLLPDFDGKPENLQSFLDAISLVDLIKGDHEGVAVNLVKTKLKGVARTLISDEATLEAVAERLKSAVKGETPKVLQAKLMAARQNSKSANSYIKEIEDLTKSLAAAYIGDGMSHSMAERYSTDSAVKALVKNASNERVKVIMESGNFTSMNEVVAKFVDSSTSSPSGGASINHLYSQPPRNNNRYRGRGHGQFRRNNRGYNSYRGQSRNFYNSNYYGGGNGYGNFSNRGRGYGRYNNNLDNRSNGSSGARPSNRARIVTTQENEITSQ